MEGLALSTASYIALALRRCPDPGRLLSIGNSRSGAGIRLKTLQRFAQPTRLMTAVRMVIGGEPASLFLPTRLFNESFGSLSDRVINSRFDSTTSALLFEAVAADLLESFEQTFGASVDVRGVDICQGDDPQDEAVNLCFEIEAPGAPRLTGYAALPDPLPRRIARAWCATEAGDAGFNPRLTLEIRVGATAFTTGEAALLREGDVVLFDRSPLLAKRGLLVVDGIFGALVDMHGAEAVMVTPFTAMDEPAMAAFDPTITVDGSMSTSVLTAVLMRSSVPLSEIEKIKVNERLPLPYGIEGPVELYSEERLFGSGHLVRTSGALGMHIARRSAHG